MVRTYEQLTFEPLYEQLCLGFLSCSELKQEYTILPYHLCVFEL